MGINLNLADLNIESLFKDNLKSLSIDEFLQQFARYDDEIKSRYEKAQKNDSVLRYVASWNEVEGPFVGIREIKNNDALANIQLTDNIIQFRSSRYSANPLVIQGPGAGPEVTAAGIFADILKLATLLGNN